MLRIMSLFLAVIFAIYVIFAIWGMVASNVEKVAYEVISVEKESEFDIEVRQYNKMIVAQVTDRGNRKQVLTNSFKLLFDYISGNNIVDKNSKINQKNGQKIAMTAPVIQTMIGDNLWQVSFIMPKKYNLDDLAKPREEKVVIQEIPASKFVVLRFSGNSTDRNLEYHANRLNEYMEFHNIRAKSTLNYAYYNPPWMPSFLRRNEVMFEIE